MDRIKRVFDLPVEISKYQKAITDQKGHHLLPPTCGQCEMQYRIHGLENHFAKALGSPAGEGTFTECQSDLATKTTDAEASAEAVGNLRTQVANALTMAVRGKSAVPLGNED